MKVNLQPHPTYTCTCHNVLGAWKEFLQNDEPAAVLDLTGFACFEEYLQKAVNATARNRYNYSYKNGYTSRLLTWEERNLYLKDIFEINTSAPIRQGKPMKENYSRFPLGFTTNTNECAEHYTRFIGCFYQGKCVAYISAHFCGKLAAVSQILGHAEYLKNGIMLSVWMEFVAQCFAKGVEKIVYSRWKDGTNGLKYWKHSVGMKSEVLKEQI